MPWAKGAWVSALMLLSVGCGGGVEPVSEENVASRADRLAGEDRTPLHRRKAAEAQLAGLEPMTAAADPRYYPWECYPERYGFTSAPGGVRFPGEFESNSGLLIGWPWPDGCGYPEQVNLIRAALGHVPVTVLAEASLHPLIRDCVGKQGVSPHELEQMQLLDLPVDSVWIRDYGPDVVISGDGTRRFVDMSYYPYGARTCRTHLADGSDKIPTQLGEQWNVPVDRPQVQLEGGNLQTDGAGTCFRARRAANERNCFDRWCYTEDELNEVIGSYHGCNVIALDSLEGDVIDHIDMWMTVLSRKTVLLGRYEVKDDPVNAAILDGNAQRLTELGYDVVRVPMPKPYCRKASEDPLAWCAVDDPSLIEPCDGTNTRVWATYMNSLRLGDVMAVPVFRWVPPSQRGIHMRQEREALATYQRALDREFGHGAVKVVPIPSDVLIPCEGSLHCIGMTYQ